jgi:hypothetical protein
MATDPTHTRRNGLWLTVDMARDLDKIAEDHEYYADALREVLEVGLKRMRKKGRLRK